VITITTGNGIPISEIIRTVEQLRPGARLLLDASLAPGTGPVIIDNALAARMLGFRPAMGLIEGVESTIRELNL
jgi:nucleoside-diphosphate-sugar epimerase